MRCVAVGDVDFCSPLSRRACAKVQTVKGEMQVGKDGAAGRKRLLPGLAVGEGVFQALVRKWKQSKPVAAMDACTFVDVGAGMGRAVLLASEMPFKAVV